jgi:hypothetical protein
MIKILKPSKLQVDIYGQKNIENIQVRIKYFFINI